MMKIAILAVLAVAATSTKTCSANLPLKNIRWAQHYAAVAAGDTNLWPAVLQILNDVTESDCIAACEANAACAGWTFKFGLETDTTDNANTCWLADEAGLSDGAATSANSNSGVCVESCPDCNQCATCELATSAIETVLFAIKTTHITTDLTHNGHRCWLTFVGTGPNAAKACNCACL
jgi:hypothetical protein